MLFIFRVLFMLMLIAASALQAQPPAKQKFGEGITFHMGSMLRVFSLYSLNNDLKPSNVQAVRIIQLMEYDSQRTMKLNRLNLPGDVYAKKRAEQEKSLEKAIARLLTDKQQTRLKQIELQKDRENVFDHLGVAAALYLTSDQLKKINLYKEEASLAERSTNERKTKKTGDASNSKEAIWQVFWEKVGELMTAKQRSKWQELLGAPLVQDPVKGMCELGGKCTGR